MAIKISVSNYFDLCTWIVLKFSNAAYDRSGVTNGISRIKISCSAWLIPFHQEIWKKLQSGYSFVT